MKRSRILFIILGAILIIALTSTLTLYIIKNTNTDDDNIVNVLAIINYGSLREPNTDEFNVTIQKGSSALEVFSKIAQLDLINYSFGVFIQGVNNYTEQDGDYWSFHYYDQITESWVYSEIGVSNYYVEDGDQIKLEYTG